MKTLIITLLCCLTSMSLWAQNKPALTFDLEIDEEQQHIFVIWPTCLENTVVTLMDSNLQPLKTQSLCHANNSIDISKLSNDLYYVKLQHYTGESIEPLVLDCMAVTAIENLEKRITFNLQPNPATNTVQISGNLVMPNSRLRLFDVNGKVLQDRIIQDEQVTLNIQDLAKGMYFVRLEQGDKVAVEQLVKR